MTRMFLALYTILVGIVAATNWANLYPQFQIDYSPKRTFVPLPPNAGFQLLPNPSEYYIYPSQGSQNFFQEPSISEILKNIYPIITHNDDERVVKQAFARLFELFHTSIGTNMNEHVYQMLPPCAWPRCQSPSTAAASHTG